MDEEITSEFQDDLPTDGISDRWGAAADAGFVPVPNSLLRAQYKLGLSSNDVVVLLNLLLHWWHRDRLPFPRSTAIASRTGLNVRTVQRSLRVMQAKGLITRVRIKNEPDRYDLTGLRTELEQFARADLWHRPEMIRRSTDGQTNGEAGRPNPVT